ncbi:hypothetical protein [Staphylococcus succinus]|uniref:hypothetical protein n=1 Tax=Staphylococcus succinus TaxID=61015 RepID=UPI000E6A8B18|nr:hypothetical protein [Staphylococcus succinus]RIN23981.1 hypothetical protein BU067_10890 [Staphylococcus succinus]
MISVDFYNEYISDLSKIKILVSKEDEEIMTSEKFINNIEIENGVNVYNLQPEINDEESFLIHCIGMQWEIYIREKDKHLIRKMR